MTARRWFTLGIAVNLAALVALVFAFPAQMVAPGPLLKDHAGLANDCFACHAPGQGIAQERCIRCHALADIGLRDTKGRPDADSAGKVAFHLELANDRCTACHTDHQRPWLARRGSVAFAHALLKPETRERCEACHTAPRNALHAERSMACGACHQTAHWKPASFEHSKLAKAALERCETCHQAPADTLHPKAAGQCLQCHTTSKWKPASFDHSRFFALDKDHAAACVTCHTGNDYKRYTCYGCHEHTVQGIRRKHDEVRGTLEDCVRCHRSADGEGGEGGEGGDDD